MPEFEKLHVEFGARGFTVIGINVDARPEKAVARYLEDIQLTFPLATDRELDVARAYRVQTMPTAFLISPDGVVLLHHGFKEGDAGMVRMLIEAALKQGHQADG